MAIEGRSWGTGIDLFRDQGLQITKPTTIAAKTIIAGRRAFLKLKETVISLEVSGFLVGAFLSVVGMPFSIWARSELISYVL